MRPYVLALAALSAVTGCNPTGDRPRAETDVAPSVSPTRSAPPAASSACAAVGGVCSWGGRCRDAANGLYPAANQEDLDHSCGQASTGPVCCVHCEVPANAPGSCCHDTYATVPVCVDGKLGCGPGARGIPAGASCSSASSEAPPTPGPVAGRTVTPTVKMTPVDDSYDDRANESWPVFEYDGLPAISTDGTKIAAVEERDGWGHTPVPGIRILDAATGRSLEFLPLVPPGTAPGGSAALQRLAPTFQARTGAANAKLARTQWESLAGVGGDRTAGPEWAVDGWKIKCDRQPDSDELARLTVVDSASGKVLLDRNLATWSRANINCATPDLRLVGVSRARKIAVFRQQLGGTLHNCDGVPVPVEYRIVHLSP